MTEADDEDAATADDDEESHGAETERPYETDRETAPQSPYTTRDVAVGAAIAAVAVAGTVVLPFLLA